MLLSTGIRGLLDSARYGSSAWREAHRDGLVIGYCSLKSSTDSRNCETLDDRKLNHSNR